LEINHEGAKGAKKVIKTSRLIFLPEEFIEPAWIGDMAFEKKLNHPAN